MSCYSDTKTTGINMIRSSSGIRSLENTEKEGKKQFELSFSSEKPYKRWFGNEILDHSEGACNLTRLKTMGVVLFNHNRDMVIGKVVSADVEDNRGKAVIEFDDDDFSRQIQQKVETGTLKGVSVSYTVEDWEDVKQGKKSADGRFQGECSIARKWEALEISIVSVPADDDVGVGRDFRDENVNPLYEFQNVINSNVLSMNEGKLL